MPSLTLIEIANRRQGAAVSRQGLDAFGVLLAAAFLLAGCGSLFPSKLPSPPAAAVEACLPRTGGPQGGPWRIAVEVGRGSGVALALVSGADIAICETGMTNGPTSVTWGTYPAVSPQILTYASSIAAADGSPSVLVGRVPPTTTAVRLVFGDGSEQAASLGSGVWLAWLSTPAEPTRIEALDASGTVVSRLADAGGVQPSD
jgi:hypothetical protein